MANVKNNVAAQETQRRLLEAAGEVFAERGYHAATIKEITDRAGAALASVNYHFRDKSELYAAVLRRIENDAARILPPDHALAGDARARLGQFIRHVAETLLGRGQPVWERVLLVRELAQPTAALDPLVETVVRPLHEKLAALIAEITGQDPRGEAVAFATCSIVAQCLYHVEHQAMVRRLHPQLLAPPRAERLAEHIADFSLAALAAHGGTGSEAAAAAAPRSLSVQRATAAARKAARRGR